MNMDSPSNPESPARDGRPLAIGVLSITAVVLLVGVAVVSAVNDRALAIGLSDRGGDYIVITMQFNNGTENVVVTDAAAQRMNVYAFDLSTRRVDIWTWADLKQLQKRIAGPRDNRARSGSGRRGY